MAKKRKRKKNRKVSVFHETHDTTMQMPFGYGSLFWAVEQGVLTAAEGMTVAFSTRYSHWDSGKSHAKSYSNIAKALAISKSYVKKLIKRVADWLKALKTTVKGKIYQIASHVFDDDISDDLRPVDEDGRPLKFAVPIGVGGPFERMIAHDISWQACWLWIVMKRHSYWDGNDEKAGQTFQLSYKALSTKTGLSRSKIASALTELKDAGMLARISAKHETGVYQLYPKPPRVAQRRKALRERNYANEKTMLNDETHIYSLNGQYRIEIETDQFEMLRRKKWVAANRDHVPAHIRIEMEDMNIQINEARRAFLGGSTDSDPSGTDSDPSGTDSDPFGFLGGVEGSDGLPF